MLYKYEICQKSHTEAPDFETEGVIMAESEQEAIEKLMNNCSVDEKDIHIESESEPDSDAEIAKNTRQSDWDDYNSEIILLK